ncbi:helix-turn-helix transcriptional regulator [Actinocatenispora rupis]|uniref:Transcriptional regulator n=1 Tax=Actinocatenispora rupis TaxID=519421 RepID=A0A8J3JH81_9ACTN|nr:helix-turn-helix transcriptional regulator [Actinocatenispora rupis]GID16347.1 transcriptional regulator [Actinocatenispora rupis]
MATTTLPVAPVESGHDPRAIRRRELARFLRSRRERITPEQVGLPPGRRRRTPGLRREEVAQLAGVGVTWYTWLEQGRDIQASEQVLNAIAGTLRLDPYERSHLCTLAGIPEPAAAKECRAVPPEVHAMLRQLNPYPATVQNARGDILAFNATYDRLVGGLSARPFEERNSLLLAFTDPAWRARIVDWDVAAPRMVAQFRAAMARHVAEPAWKDLVRRLRQASPEFAELWERHEVKAPENLTKRYRSVDVGLVHLRYTHLWFGPRTETRLTTYTPADAGSADRLAELYALATA